MLQEADPSGELHVSIIYTQVPERPSISFNSLGATWAIEKEYKENTNLQNLYPLVSEKNYPEFNRQWDTFQASFMDIEKVAVLEAYKNIKKFFEPRTKNVTITLTPDTSIHATARFDNFKFFVERKGNNQLNKSSII